MKRVSEDAYVREEGRAEGREEGRAEGREEGRAEGREEGRAEEREIAEAEKTELLQQAEVNRKADKLNTAKRLLAMGLSIEEAAKGSDLDYNTVCKLT